VLVVLAEPVEEHGNPPGGAGERSSQGRGVEVHVGAQLAHAHGDREPGCLAGEAVSQQPVER
jgi:hypothetical protein